MFRLLLLVFLFFTKTCFCENGDLTEIYPKCCDSESVLNEISSNNNTYFNCTKDNDLRTQINTKIFFNKLNTTLFCIDIVNNKIKLFKYSKIDDGDSFILEKPLNKIDLFPKCCPLNYFYNPKTHGCVKSIENQTFSFYAKRKFFKIGLQSCKIIVDSRDEKYLTQFNSTRIPQNQCIDQDEKSKFIFRVCKEDYEICAEIKCIRKCCPDGQSFVNRAFCKNTFVHGLQLDNLSANIENSNDDFAVIHGYRPNLYKLNGKDYKFYLDRFGTFSVEEVSKSKILETKRYQIEDEEYCIEHVSTSALSTFLFFRPFPVPESIPLKFVYTRIAMGISCVFLILTILYYCLSKEKQTVFGKILISYCFASLIAFILISYLAYQRPRQDWCKILAFLVYYSTLATFTWMNIMSIDIYCTFGSFKAFSSFRNKTKELKRFILYSLYGWGAPLVLTSVTLTFYNIPTLLPTSLKVLIPKDKCTISNGRGNYAKLLFLTLYLTILQLINLILFIKTILCCLKVKREITKMNDTNTLKGEKKMTFNNFKDRFGLLMKLFLIMGISFIFEVVSTFYNFQNNETTTIIEIVWDTFNSLQGFFIFVIFILKKRILLQCKKRLVPRLRKVSLMSSIMTQTTSLPPTSRK